MDQSNVAVGNIRRGSVALNDTAGSWLADAAGAPRRGSMDRYREQRVRLAPDALLLSGLGCVSVSKNGVPVIELDGIGGNCEMTVGDIERLALTEPEQDWRIHIVSLLDDRHYRREGAGIWRLFARGYGLS
jgi:hypothetical protein